MAFIHCVQGGSPIERIEGEFEGAAGNTTAGQITVESKQGKTPVRAFFWKDGVLPVTGAASLFWCTNFGNYKSVQYNNAWAGRTAEAPSQSYCAAKIEDHSILFMCPVTAANYQGTFKYIVEFE